MKGPFKAIKYTNQKKNNRHKIRNHKKKTNIQIITKLRKKKINKKYNGVKRIIIVEIAISVQKAKKKWKTPDHAQSAVSQLTNFNTVVFFLFGLVLFVISQINVDTHINLIQCFTRITVSSSFRI